MKIICLFFFILTSISCFSQEIVEQIKGKWTIAEYHGVGTYGHTYLVAKMLVGDTITINNKIWMSMEENEYTKAMGITPEKCDYRPIEYQKIENVEEYFSEKYQVKPIALGIESQRDEIYIIRTDCKDNFFKEIIVQKGGSLYLYKAGIFYLLKRIEKQ